MPAFVNTEEYYEVDCSVLVMKQLPSFLVVVKLTIY